MIRFALSSLTVWLAAAGFVVAADESSQRPNVVLIMADDLGQGDLGCYNSASRIPTPHLDAISAEGIRFTDAHSPSAVCTPTRYGLLTGRYAWRSSLKSGVLNGYSPALLEAGRATIASMLQSAGYETGCAGKWHLGLGSSQPTDYSQPLSPGGAEAGFDSFFAIPASLDMPPYVWVTGTTTEEPPTEEDPGSERRWSGGGGFWRGGPIAPGFRHVDVMPRTVAESVRFIGARAGEERPFFLYVPFSAPHTPWLPTDEFTGSARAGYYGDFVAQVDAAVGSIRAALEKSGALDNTLFIFTSDNGAHWRPQDIKRYSHHANNGRRGMKADIHEGGHRVPFLVRWPDHVEPGRMSDETICLTDVMATVASAAGVSLPASAAEDSYDLTPVLQAADYPRPLREATVHHSAQGLFAIRQGRWKLIEGLGSGGFTAPRKVDPKPGGPTGQLYDLAADPTESNNLWQDHPEVVDRLASLLESYRQSGRSTPARQKGQP